VFRVPFNAKVTIAVAFLKPVAHPKFIDSHGRKTAGELVN